ncbi:MAG: VWA domain-containing protein [Bacteroidota bacterium]
MNSFTTTFSIYVRCSRLTTLLWFALLLLITPAAFGQGVAIVDAAMEEYLYLASNHVDVRIEDQVAIVTTTQRFENNSGASVRIAFGFPMAEDASPTSIRWLLDETWYRGLIEAVPQDTTLPGIPVGGNPAAIDNYLGATPFRFDVTQTVPADSSISIELQYVQLLPYAFGNVSFSYPNQYESVQTDPVLDQLFTFDLTSQRTIEEVTVPSHGNIELNNTGNAALLSLNLSELPMDMDVEVQYSLSQDELGLFGFSTFLPDSLVADGWVPGFFTFIAEPDASDNSAVIDKVFTLIIDRSGSMGGSKIQQARDAASFIVNNLNEGDQFNIIDFSRDVTSLGPEHVAFDETSKAEALAYIAGLRASGGTNIAEALTTAISQFASADANTANLIVFFTDGVATVGERDTPTILNLVESTVAQTDTNPILFTFGIGSAVDTQLLTLLATNNQGLAEFLGSDELEQRITDFYLRIRNPVVLNTSISFDKTGISEIFPNPLPSLYKGQQMIVSGRYREPGPINISLNGNAFGQPVSYTYTLNLADSAVTSNQFLTKVWAKQKIEELLVAYYSFKDTSSEALALREEIIGLSLSFGIVTPFTSFQGSEEDGGMAVSNEDEEELPGGIEKAADVAVQILSNYPNPFRTTTTLQVQVNQLVDTTVMVRIYDSLGRLVRTLSLPVHQMGRYEIEWDGTTDAGVPVSAGTYVAVATYGDVVWSHVISVIR